jgi:hypothetical protein
MNLSVKIESILLAVAMSLFNKYLSSVPHIFATWKKFEKNAMNSIKFLAEIVCETDSSLKPLY